MTDYRLNQEDIQVFIGPLKEILAQELRAGNTVKETWRGDWPYPHVIAVSLSKPFLTPVKKDMWNIDFAILTIFTTGKQSITTEGITKCLYADFPHLQICGTNTKSLNTGEQLCPSFLNR